MHLLLVFGICFYNPLFVVYVLKHLCGCELGELSPQASVALGV